LKIYTKKGDEGNSSLVFGQKVRKDDQRIEAYGTVDELNAWIGKLADEDIDTSRIQLLRTIQNTLFVVGSNLASEKESEIIPKLQEENIQLIEIQIDNMQASLPELRQFILPGGHTRVSNVHIARTVCRRAEREVVKLAATQQVNALMIKYLNRLSDYLFVLSRKLAQELAVTEIKWEK
jgi:cob(I)alamin adenosyltransferase